MSILIERASFEDRAKFFRKNRPTISRLLEDLAEPAKHPKQKKKAKAKAKVEAKPKEKEVPKAEPIASPIVEEPNLSVEELAVNPITAIELEEVPTVDLTESTASCAPPDTLDDLTEIKGIGAKMAENLSLAGITTFEQIANLTEVQIANLGKSIRGFAASCKRKDFKKQAQELNQ